MHIDINTPFASQYRIWVRGEEVTRRCFEADNDAVNGNGYALCYVLDPATKVFRINAERTAVMTERLTGPVKMIGPALPIGWVEEHSTNHDFHHELDAEVYGTEMAAARIRRAQ